MNGMVKKILLVEDEEKIAAVVKSFLESKGFSVLIARDGKAAIELFDPDEIAILLLDLMLPELSGEEVCRMIRNKSKVPIIMLTAKSDEEDMLKGLGIGADDYITKPFSLKTLYARMEAVMRRSAGDLTSLSAIKTYGDGELTIDLGKHLVIKNSVEVKLTPNEFKLLAAFASYPNKVFTREELISTAFGEEYDGFDRTIDSHIKNLRQKLEDDPKEPRYIKTIHGLGYKMASQ
jgi:DNA-binding response OmpR family regulator